MTWSQSSERRLYLTKKICRNLPPIIAHQIQQKLINSKDGTSLALDFEEKSITGGIFRGNTKDIVAFKFFIHGYFDWRNIVLIKKIFDKRKGNIIEVGANIGTETISFSKICNEKVYAIEPLAANFRSLQELKKVNKLKNLHLLKVLVSDYDGRANFKYPEENNSGTGYLECCGKESVGEYEVITLDEKFSTIKTCSAIIIDVEGFELNVINGAIALIQKFKPFLIIEVNPNYLKNRANKNVPSLISLLDDLRYKCFYITKLGLKEVNWKNYKNLSNKNWICIPEGCGNQKSQLASSILFNAFNPFIKNKIL